MWTHQKDHHSGLDGMVKTKKHLTKNSKREGRGRNVVFPIPGDHSTFEVLNWYQLKESRAKLNREEQIV